MFRLFLAKAAKLHLHSVQIHVNVLEVEDSISKLLLVLLASKVRAKLASIIGKFAQPVTIIMA